MSVFNLHFSVSPYINLDILWEKEMFILTTLSIAKFSDLKVELLLTKHFHHVVLSFASYEILFIQ